VQRANVPLFDAIEHPGEAVEAAFEHVRSGHVQGWVTGHYS